MKITIIPPPNVEESFMRYFKGGKIIIPAAIFSSITCVTLFFGMDN